MKTLGTRPYVSLILIAILFFPSAGMALRQIGWKDLIGTMPPYDDSFHALSSDQLTRLSIVAQLRERKTRIASLPEHARNKLRALEQNLQEQGIDVDEVLVKLEIVKAKRKAAAKTVNYSLDGQRIRMPGYVLPLEFDGELVTELLLVPFVGACIHVPPPPPNQIVHVKLKKGYKSQGNFAPVWVEGQIQVGKSEQDLYLGDGSAEIPVGYSLRAEHIEPYQVSR